MGGDLLDIYSDYPLTRHEEGNGIAHPVQHGRLCRPCVTLDLFGEPAGSLTSPAEFAAIGGKFQYFSCCAVCGKGFILHCKGATVERYKKIVGAICLVFEIFAAVSLGAMVVIVAGNVISRYFFNVTPGWTEETARLLMIQFCFIAMAMGVRDKIHIALTAIVDRMPKKIILPLEIIGKVLIGLLGVMICGFMWPYILKLSDNRLPGTGLPVGISYLIPTLTGGLLTLITIYQIYDHFKYGTDEAQKKEGDFSKEMSTL
jgi:TRAP-type C4-dicarboxylate transport system permease small subunit